MNYWDDKDLANHGAIPYGQGLTGVVRDLPDVDLSDHGAVTYDTGLSGVMRDLPDVDLSDHGAVTYGTGLSGVVRDLPDVDLSDHGAVPYAPKSDTWGTNDEEIAKEMDILMHASYATTADKAVPMFNAASLAKVVEYRYRMVAGILNDCKYGMSKDDKVRVGSAMFMDLIIIDKMIQSNPNCYEAIFDPSLYSGSKTKTDVFGVLEQYQADLASVNVAIPLINTSTDEVVMDASGNVVTVDQVIQNLMEKAQAYKPEQTTGRTR